VLALDLNKLARELEKAYDKMKNDKATYTVHELLSPGHGEGNYKLEFHAKKKGGFGLLSSVANIAKGAIYGGIEGAVYHAAEEVARRKLRATFEPIDKEMKGHEIASLLKRWSQTVKEGYIETIGSTLLLPKDPDYISATIKPSKEIRLVIDFARIKGAESTEPTIQPTVPQQVSTPPTIPVAPSPPVAIPPNIAMMLPTMLPQIYLVGSLKNTDDGFQFTFHNGITTVSIIAPIELTVDGKPIDTENIFLIIGNTTRPSKDISASNPLVFNHGEQLVIKVKGTNLSAGTHSIGIKTRLQGFGTINFTISDNIS